MLERRRIVELARTAAPEVLITLVRAEGSSYRRPGAHLLLGSGGSYAGTISGGCLEAEVSRKALWMIRNGPHVERYSTMFDDTAEIPYGLGCGGTVDLLFEPAQTSEAHALLTALEASLTGAESIVTTWLPGAGQPLRRTIVTPTGEVLFTSATRPHSSQQMYREHLEAPQRLILLGAGDDAKPAASIAALLGWTVVVADGRPQLARADRFPEAHTVLTLRSTKHCAEALALRSADAVVLMTHSYEQDRDCLASLLANPTPLRYIGLLGARHRTALLVSEAASLTGHSVAACCDRVYAPVGLDLGGDGPEAIALAIVAEVQACCQGKLAASRRLTARDVAAQLEQGGATRYLQVQCALEQAS